MPSSQPSWIIWRTFYRVLKIINFLSVKNTCLDHAYLLICSRGRLEESKIFYRNRQARFLYENQIAFLNVHLQLHPNV